MAKRLTTKTVARIMYGRPLCKGFLQRWCGTVACGHVSGLLTRRYLPLAMMEAATQVPIKSAR